ncbi:proline racemase [Lichtheimia corymbifera JMRC:FSU:9682]|uniref:trans-L-3-hydroxyproline dehydratase n=1 Tax=Lichtheimia corymbifera JMRC:FSU:9682 TaxID=1263082 RepID=A0A068S0F4_9FUNG|nr:proline racemase [Lichtheimia corymbifera JMRC:FSU:9682]
MENGRVICTVEMHTGGEPFRIVTSGIPRMPGKTIVERRAWLKENADDLRRALMLEPRGHADMYGGYLTDPISPGADFGIIFVHNEGYSDHCGHGTIALATVAVQLGWIQHRTIPETRVGIDAPCGFIEAWVTWDGKRASSVRFINVPSFIWKRDVTVNTPTFGNVTGDIAFGGAFYFYTDGAPHDIKIHPRQLTLITQFGTEVKQAVNAAIQVQHPDIPEINHIYGTIVAAGARGGDDETSTTSTHHHQANCCIFADSEVDRSPTGSGTAGRVAQLYLRGQLAKDQVLVNESIIGSVFKGKVLKETKVGSFDAVIPQIEGSAHIVGHAQWIIDESDPLTYGFLVK